MQLYWKCDECDETNPYPNAKVCETCGTPMSVAAEQRVLREQKEEEKRHAQIKKEQKRKRREEQQAKQEAERKNQKALRAAQQAEQKRKKREKHEQALKKREERETKLGYAVRKSTIFSSRLMRSFAVLAVVFTVFLFIKNADNVNLDNSFNAVSDNIHREYLAHTVVINDGLQIDAEENVDVMELKTDKSNERVSRILNKLDAQLSIAFSGVSSNIGHQVSYLKNTYDPVDNISNLFENIVEFLSGGVKK